ncbi:BamA/TamA family outer membrane protein [Candidatus Neomarinimicrobiota bacterium]
MNRWYDQWRGRARTRVLLLAVFLTPITGVLQARLLEKYSVGLLPALDYSSDKGFGYGILMQLDDKSKAEYSPYFVSHRFVFQQTTKGIADYSYRFDSKYLLPGGIRFTLDTRYQVSLFEPFHGPGGAQTDYTEAFTDPDDPDYRGKFYYTYDRRTNHLRLIFQKNLPQPDLRVLWGIVFQSTKFDSIDYSSNDEPDTLRSLLANNWNNWQRYASIYPGGWENALILGLVYDKRDHELSPRTGFWSEVLMRWVPGISMNDFEYLAVSATHRQYMRLSDKLVLAGRVSGRYFSENAPFFALSQVDGSFVTDNGLGGKKTIRGVLWQRVLGYKTAFGNLELRYFAKELFKTGYVALNLFTDAGRSFDKQVTEFIGSSEEQDQDQLHVGYGIGMHAALSNTFVTALDIAFPLNAELDGSGMKLYIGLDWLF